MWDKANSQITLDENNEQEYLMLVRKGWLSFNDTRSSVDFICPLSKQIILNKLHLQLSRPQKDNFNNLAQFFDACLTKFSPEFICESSLSINCSGGINESKWQKEVYRIGMSLLGRDCELGVEVSCGYVDKMDVDSSNDDDDDENEKEYFKIPGKVDFYINSKRKWALELLVRGDLKSNDRSFTELESHSRRFTHGNYKNLPREDELVVDFRPTKFSHSGCDVNLENPPKKYLPNTWIVFYPEDGRRLYVIKYGNDEKLSEKKEIQLFSNT